MKIDCRGLACPQPVLETKKALESGAEEILVLLDDAGSKENVRRFAEGKGHRVRVSEAKGIFEVRIERKTASSAIPDERGPEKKTLSPDFVLFVDSDAVGRGPEELGKALMKSFLQTLEQSDAHPQKIILMNSGVKLACEGSEVLEDLQEFSSKGVEILSCGMCLDYFGIKKSLRAGRISNMYEILNCLASAGKVIKI